MSILTLILCHGPSNETMYVLLLLMLVFIVGSGALSAWWIRKNPAGIRSRQLNIFLGVLMFVLTAAIPLLVAAISLSILAS